MKHIVTLVDFTRISDAALAQAALIAKKANGKLILLHMAPEDQRAKEKQLLAELQYAIEVLGTKSFKYELKICFGNFFDHLEEQLTLAEADLVVVGTHGIRGNTQNMFSNNLVRLLRGLSIAKIIVQGQRDMAPSNLEKWLVVGNTTAIDADLHWLAEACEATLLSNTSELKNEALETEAFDTDCTLIVWKGAPDEGIDLILNGYGIPVLLL